jgi:hypothetical protein
MSSPYVYDKANMARAVARMLLEIDAVLFRADEPFKLTSGMMSPVYIDCRKIIAFPRMRAAMMGFGATVIMNDIDHNATTHDKGQRRIPQAENIQKASDLGRVQHACYSQSNTEQSANQKAAKQSHYITPAWRTRYTVMTAVSMKVMTATSERGDSRARPQMPCPDVHPDPSAAPNPTSKPASGRTQPEATGVISMSI